MAAPATAPAPAARRTRQQIEAELAQAREANRGYIRAAEGEWQKEQDRKKLQDAKRSIRQRAMSFGVSESELDVDPIYAIPPAYTQDEVICKRLWANNHRITGLERELAALSKDENIADVLAAATADGLFAPAGA